MFNNGYTIKIFGIILLVSLLIMSANATTVCSSGCDFSNIQAAIDVANSGDTINVLSGTYYEQVVIDKSLTLLGENRDNTVIDGGGGQVVVVDIIADDCVISGFTFRNGWYGVRVLQNQQNNIITNNIASNMAGDGMHLAAGSHHNTISNNILNSNAYDGLFIVYSSNYNTISGNTANSNGYYGLLIQQSHYNTIKNNDIQSNAIYGIYMHEGSSNNIFYKNNLIDNYPNAVDSGINQWDYNHWSDFDESNEGCDDLNNDNICDTPYTINSLNIDYHPLISWVAPSTIANLKFIVTDITGSPIIGATVQSKDDFKGKTDSSGTVTFEVPLGDYKYWVRMKDCVKVTNIVSVTEDTIEYVEMISRKSDI